MQLAELLARGRLLRRQNRVEAIDCFEQCIKQAEESKDNILVATASAELALELAATHQPSALKHAKDLLDQSEVVLKSCNNCALEIFYVWYCQGYLELQAGRYDEALSYLQVAYQGYQSHPEGLARVEDALGQYYMAINDFPQALSYLERSLARREPEAYDSDKTISYGYLGAWYLQAEQYEVAENYFGQSLDWSLQFSDHRTQLQALSGLGRVAIAQGQWETAEILIRESVQLVQEPLDTDQVAFLYCDLSEVLLATNQGLESQKYLENEALPRFKRLQNQRGLATVNHLLGQVYKYRILEGIDSLTEKTIENAEDYLLEASLMFEENGMIRDYAQTLYDLASLYNLPIGSQYRYQYQGKAIRSLELAADALKRFNYNSSNLFRQIDHFSDQLIGQFGF